MRGRAQAILLLVNTWMIKLFLACNACWRHSAAAVFPVVHVTTAYQVTDVENPHTDMGLWHKKIPVDAVDLKNEDIWAIDSRIAPIEGEQVLLKKCASSFQGTYLANFLR